MKFKVLIVEKSYLEGGRNGQKKKKKKKCMEKVLMEAEYLNKHVGDGRGFSTMTTLEDGLGGRDV